MYKKKTLSARTFFGIFLVFFENRALLRKKPALFVARVVRFFFATDYLVLTPTVMSINSILNVAFFTPFSSLTVNTPKG